MGAERGGVLTAATPLTAGTAVRGVVAAVTATFVALMSHLLGGGAAPGALGVAVPLLLATTTCLVLARVRLPWLRLTASVGVSQVLFHVLFTLGATSPAPAAATTGAAGHLAHDAPAAGALAAAAGADGAGHAAHLAHGAGTMWLAHAVAALVTVLALRHGEAALTRVRGALARTARRLVRPALPAAPVRPHVPAARIVDERAWLPRARVLVAGSVVRRGPPARALPAVP